MPRRTKPLRPRRRTPRQIDLFEGPQAGMPGWFGLPTQTQAALIELMTRLIRKRSLAPIDLRTTDACDSVSFCGGVTPEDGMSTDARVVEDQVNGFAGRVEVMEGPSGRRAWPDEVKARIVRESLEPGVTVSEVARRHRISPQQLTQWRRAARQGRLPVSVGCDEKIGGGLFVPLAIDMDRRESASVVTDLIVIEMNGMVLKLPAQTAARRIAEIVFALEARR